MISDNYFGDRILVNNNMNTFHNFFPQKISDKISFFHEKLLSQFHEVGKNEGR